jgi:NADH dehydrogenase
VHISALGASADGPSEYLRSKARGEAEILKARAHGIRTTIFRPSVVFGRGDSFLTLFAGLVTLPTPVIPLAGAGARFQPVFVEDLARAVTRLLDEPAADGQCLELCGPHIYTLRELVQYTATLVGVRRLVLPLPGPLAWLQAFVLEHLPGRLMSRDNLASMRVDNVCGCAFPEVLGFAPTPLEAVAPGYLGQRSERARYNTLRERAGR